MFVCDNRKMFCNEFCRSWFWLWCLILSKHRVKIDFIYRGGWNFTPDNVATGGCVTRFRGKFLVNHVGEASSIRNSYFNSYFAFADVRATSSPIAPAVSTIPFPFQQQPVARSGSNVSHHGSGRLTAVPTQMRIPSPVAAEARIQRLMFAPMMTVSSAPVAPIKPTVVSGVASTSVTSVRPLNTFVVDSVTAPPPQPMMVAQPMTYVTSMPPPPLHDVPVYQVAHSFSAPPTTQPLHHTAFQQSVQQQVATALPGAYLQPSPSVVAMMMPPPAHRPNTLQTGTVYANDEGYNVVHNEGYNAVHNEGYNAVHNEGYNALHAPPAMSLPSYDSYRRSSLQNTPQMSPIEPVASVSPLQRSLPPSPGFSTATALRKMSAPQMSAPSYSVYADVHCDEASTHPLPSDLVVMDTMGQASQNTAGSGQQSPGESKAWSDQVLLCCCYSWNVYISDPCILCKNDRALSFFLAHFSFLNLFPQIDKWCSVDAGVWRESAIIHYLRLFESSQ